MSKSAFITGSTRGLGLELVRQLAQDKKNYKLVIASGRSKTDELDKLMKTNPQIAFVKLDVNDEASMKSAFQETTKLLGKSGLDLLVNNAGIHDPNLTLNDCTMGILQNHFSINVCAPVAMCKIFFPLMLKSTAKPAVIFNMSSGLGSLSLVESDFMWIPYRMTKAALNMLTVCLAKGECAKSKGAVIAVSIHPGWVATATGGPNAPMTTLQSVSGIVSVLNSLNQNSNGKFIGFDGKEIPW
jgi:NAD(P)-dependent dehydrogenase (short-subunit alcohol dehydrogenase family)